MLHVLFVRVSVSREGQGVCSTVVSTSVQSQPANDHQTQSGIVNVFWYELVCISILSYYLSIQQHFNGYVHFI